ncbi:DUF3850 domain-containing protein [Pseudomonas sp. NMI542_15]|uniref:DUF3850 domain-containing protein n=1 Tax=Pseudomonas sp. NMI542_15 TaxID=2903148 RepID=UPI001E407E6F|nr:DUF3850 domain-containing protein [Pseudomonas sp. NMI542_15]MCE0778879.1 DUF3850 domain-containing protein [Pseudomonas sp. NMI542_15]
MPTEKRSSNTEMVSVPREHELKIRQTPLADLLSGLKTGEIRDCSDREFAVGDTVVLREIDDSRDYTGTVLRRTITHVQKNYGLPDHLCVLSYGQPAPQPHPEPIAWMVGTAFWWTKEEAERDAAATGLPIIAVGPITDTASPPVECIHEWTDDGEFMLVCTACGTQENHDPKWRDMASAPRDGMLVRLLVEFTEHATEDSESMPSPTIGANSYDHTGEDVWQFAGWSWEQDCFTQGAGDPIGWLPLLDTPHTDPCEVERLRSAIKQQKSLIASLRAELVESRSIDASAEPTAAIEIDHDALIAAVCVLRSQGLGNLSQAVEVARAALERKPY